MARNRKVTDSQKETAVAKLTEQVQKADAAETTATKERHRKFAFMLKAFNGGLTYDEIAEITGLSKIRVSQVLAEQREKATPPAPPAKAKAPARKAPAKTTPAKRPARKRAA